jgi:transposase InsO family protein
VTRLCALYGVTPAGYYAWRRRPESARAAQDRQLTQRITALFTAHRGRYGSPRIYRELRDVGWRVSRRRVERLMRAAGLRARVARVYRANPGLHRFYGQHPNRLPRDGARRPDQVWVGDITYLPVGRGQWRFLAVVLDQYSRRVLAWTLGRRRDARLTCRVLGAAVRRRRPPRGLIFHSDRGSEYSAGTFRDRLVALGIRQSSAQRGPKDNAHMESFFHSLKAEVVHGARFETEAALRYELARYVRYYNHQRLHSALAYRSPVDYESRAA